MDYGPVCSCDRLPSEGTYWPFSVKVLGQGLIQSKESSQFKLDSAHGMTHHSVYPSLVPRAYFVSLILSEILPPISICHSFVSQWHSLVFLLSSRMHPKPDISSSSVPQTSIVVQKQSVPPLLHDYSTLLRPQTEYRTLPTENLSRKCIEIHFD